MASNNSLQKLLVNVPSASCDAFIKQYINPEWDGTVDTVANTVVLPAVAADHNTAYDGKVVFLEKYHAIFTQGALFGYDKDFHNILKDLIAGVIVGESETNKGIKVTTKLTYEAENENEQPKLKITNTVVVNTAKYSNGVWDSSISMTNVVDAQSVKDYVDDSVKTAVDAAAVTAMEYKGGLTQNGFDAFANTNTEDKKSLDGNVYVAEEEITISATEKAEIGDTIIVHYDEALAGKLGYVVIERNVDNTVTAGNTYDENKILIAGAGHTAHTTGYVTGLDTTAYTAFGTANTLATEVATAAYVVGKLGELDASVTYNANVNNYVSYTYNQTDGLITYVNVGLKVAEYTYTAGSEDTLSTFTYNTYGLIDHVILNNYMSYVGDQITKLQEYVDNVDPSYITVAPSGDYVTVTPTLTGGENSTANDYTYTVSVITKALGDAVGMYVGEDGKWHAADGTVTADGLATAADVAKEIVENEKVIAAALNDHEARLDALENDIDNLGETITSSFEALDGTATASDANNYVSVTINEVDGKLTNDGSSLTVEYGTVDADLQVTKGGLIDAAQLAHVLNNINLWETFNPTPEA